MEHVEEDGEKVRPWIKLPAVGLFFSSIGILFTISLLNPGKRGPVAILLFLDLLYVVFLSIFIILLGYAYSIFSTEKLSRQKAVYSSVILATGLIFLVGLHTLGQLQMIDIILVIIFEFLLNFYFFRRF